MVTKLGDREADLNGADVFIYSGSIDRRDDYRFIQTVFSQNTKSKAKTALVVMTSGGGSPDAAYKMARYLQYRYDSYSVLVSGICKSAATLFCIGATEIIFCPYGELGPLDIQMKKSDSLIEFDSGLNISEAISSLEGRVQDAYLSQLAHLTDALGPSITFKTMSDAVASTIQTMYGPIFARIDPEEVGSRTRAMRIGEDYAIRLNMPYKNLREDHLNTLSRSYASHGFVIDNVEAKALFHQVRLINEEEAKIVDFLGEHCRHPAEGQGAFIQALPNSVKQGAEVANDDSNDTKQREVGADGSIDRGNSAEASTS